jgi:hypothetical protein
VAWPPGWGSGPCSWGPPRAQATPELFRWPQLIAVTDLDSALVAVEEIIEQGEGARGDWRQAHYGRFLEIYEDYRLRQSDPSFEPARPVMAAFTRQPFDIAAAQPLISDPATAHVAELASLAYELILHLLTRFFTHTDETEEQLGILIGSAIDTMAGALRPLGSALATLPAGAAHPGFTTGFAFVADEAVRRAQQCAGKVAATLAAHVPAELRPRDGGGSTGHHANQA